MKWKLIRAVKSVVQYGDFTLASGKKSNHYIDIRNLTMSANGLQLIGPMMENAIRQFHPDAVGGMATAAIPLISAILVYSQMHLNGFYVRKDMKVHGLGHEVEGNLIKRSRVVVVDDVGTSGGSMAKVIEKIAREYECLVVGAAVVLDRQEGATELLAQMEVPLVSLVTIKDLELDND